LKKILLTGSTGFVGKRFVEYSFCKYDITTFSLVDRMPSIKQLENIETIVHLGGMAHQSNSVLAEKYFEANFEKTKELADLAKLNKVGHFIFISTVKVFGEHSNKVLTRDSKCEPLNDPYGESKLKAEQYLNSITNDDFVVSIIRPPLIYGPGVKGNLDRLIRLCDSNYLLPFGAIDNRRTFIFLDNLIELIHCIINLKKSGIFLAGDLIPISTSELILAIRKCLGRKPRLFKLSDFIKKIIHFFLPALGTRLFGSMEIDTSKSYNELGFYPPYTFENGIKSMVDYYVNLK
jgi:nucleoside-diphosphate-sugar epimerase